MQFVIYLYSEFTLEQPWRPREGVDLWLYSSFNLRVKWGWVVNDIPRPLYPPPPQWAGTHSPGPPARLNGCGKSRLHRDSIPGPSSPLSSRYTHYAIPAKILMLGSHNTELRMPGVSGQLLQSGSLSQACLERHNLKPPHLFNVSLTAQFN